VSKTDATDTSWIKGVPRTPSREQAPWLTADDAKGWTRIGHGRGKGKPPRISVQVD
jgi:hypothetical protein